MWEHACIHTYIHTLTRFIADSHAANSPRPLYPLYPLGLLSSADDLSPKLWSPSTFSESSSKILNGYPPYLLFSSNLLGLSTATLFSKKIKNWIFCVGEYFLLFVGIQKVVFDYGQQFLKWLFHSSIHQFIHPPTHPSDCKDT